MKHNDRTVGVKHSPTYTQHGHMNILGVLLNHYSASLSTVYNPLSMAARDEG